MSGWDYYIYAGLIILLIVLAWRLLRLRASLKHANSRQRYLMETLELAQSQFVEFNIKPESADGKAGYSALLEEITDKSLILDANGFVPNDLQGKNADVFFRAQREEGPVFYAFQTVLEKVSGDYENVRLTLKIPDHLRIEKKRHFIRVQPDKEDIRVIGVWHIEPGKRLPRSTSDIGAPATHFKPDMDSVPVQVENISGSGLALRFSGENMEEMENRFPKGSQVLCLVIYVLENAEKPVAFWCSGEIMNSRIREGSRPELILGLEFTNWAVLESSSSEIHWAHSSPTKGAKPILQWVAQVEKKQAASKR